MTTKMGTVKTVPFDIYAILYFREVFHCMKSEIVINHSEVSKESEVKFATVPLGIT